jgi:hypothetical protein
MLMSCILYAIIVFGCLNYRVKFKNQCFSNPSFRGTSQSLKSKDCSGCSTPSFITTASISTFTPSSSSSKSCSWSTMPATHPSKASGPLAQHKFCRWLSASPTFLDFGEWLEEHPLSFSHLYVHLNQYSNAGQHFRHCPHNL